MHVRDIHNVREDMGDVGVPEILIIAFLIFIFFGAKKIPEIAQGLGKGIKEFRKAAREIQEEQPEESRPPVAQQLADQQALCVHCNARIPMNSRFCPSCGKPQEGPRKIAM